mmetsp:Transcript_17847/g.58348  ORF Transcript_17847/g.58348 Transcript_17847/m.58348 type:complete len:210 (-) Transcript_17847:486-1115(-)
MHGLAIAAIDHVDLLGAEALEEAVRAPLEVELAVDAADEHRLATAPPLLELGQLCRELATRHRTGACLRPLRLERVRHSERRAAEVGSRRRAGRMRRVQAEEDLYSVDDLGHGARLRFDGASILVLMRGDWRLAGIIAHVAPRDAGRFGLGRQPARRRWASRQAGLRTSAATYPRGDGRRGHRGGCKPLHLRSPRANFEQVARTEVGGA